MTGTSSHKVVARGAGSNAFSFVIRFGARAAFLWVAARLYGASHYGVFSMASAMVELAVPIASLGLKRMIFPWLEEETATRPAMHVVADALLLATLASVAVTIIVAAGAMALPAGAVSDALRLAIIVLAPAVLGQVTADVAFAATRWTHKMRYEVIGRGLVEPYALTAGTLAGWYFGMTGIGLLAAYWGASALLAGFALWSARHCLGPWQLQRWRPRGAALAQRARSLLSPSGADFLTILAQRIDLYLVGFLLGDAPAGVYNVLRQLRTPILQVRQSFDGILTPLTARTMMADGDARTGVAMAAAIRVILAIQLGVVLLMVAAGKPLLGLFGPQYVSGYPALVAMVVAEAITGAFGVSELILYYRRPALALQVNLAIIVMAAILTVLAAPHFGLLAASGAMLVAAIASALLRRAWLAGIGVRNPALHAAVPVVAMGAGVAMWLALGAVLPAGPLAFAAPACAIALYTALMLTWRRMRPEALSMAAFRA